MSDNDRPMIKSKPQELQEAMWAAAIFADKLKKWLPSADDKKRFRFTVEELDENDQPLHSCRMIDGEEWWFTDFYAEAYNVTMDTDSAITLGSIIAFLYWEENPYTDPDDPTKQIYR